ncbi:MULTISPECIES: L-2-hydroxyglutarate oxidase [Xanthocytophaga]|uniref:L-2-hydroxyglutarate oxidase n=2 Tax=Xanthocytophaga TaxID=3078918 RepID=A0AAE3QVC0_9BACT|nr:MULTISPECIES: L-2-hydroxyglutarate oxidase [Xanthocytophaga]MDJ1483955.1 L-2-hydroxyglutarate oxidase [Xanthocytophaga flavus]MDJ1499861.1 L-2-hydroxyglutarate oxidase [Xanthocytophaga agilis]
MKYDILVVGGGIVGLATALRLKKNKPDLKIILLEKEKQLAKHQTGNNSGVIHSGIYYKPGSLKATNCINGYNELLEFCRENDIKFDLCGKIIVATSQEELPALENIYNRGIQNGLTDIRKISQAEIREHEPHCSGISGIWVPYTGIIDYTDVSYKYAEVFKKLGGEILHEQKVLDIKPGSTSTEVITDKQTFETKLVINCAGLFSDKIAALTHKNINVRIIPFRGEYYEIKKEKEYLVKGLIYPVPDPNFPFLGVHFTRMVKGGVEAGPNAVFSFKREGYKKTDFNWSDFSESIAWPGFRKVAAKYWRTGLGEYYRSFSKAAFTKALQKLIPEIQENDLIPGNAGVRAQACDRTGGLIDDFMILEDKHIINVCNAPSPAATSSLSIGKTVAEMALQRFNSEKKEIVLN